MSVEIVSAISPAYFPNGVTVEFPFAFKIDSVEQLRVVDGDGAVIDPLLFSVILNANEGGKVVFFVAPTALQIPKLFIESNPDFTQSRNFDNSGTSFNPATLTSALDESAIRDLYLREHLRRSVQMPRGEDQIILPNLDARKGKYFKWDNITGQPITDDPDNFAAPAKAAADLAVSARDVILARSVDYANAAEAQALASEGDKFTYYIGDEIALGKKEGGIVVALPGPWINADKIGLSNGNSVQHQADLMGAVTPDIGPHKTAAQNRTELQAAADFVRANAGVYLQIPAGQIDLDGDVFFRPRTGGKPAEDQFLARGIGVGKNGSYLNFLSGSLVVLAANHALYDLHIRSADSDGIIVRPSDPPAQTFATRSFMQNVRAEDCFQSGIVIEDCWIYTMVNVYARRNKWFGIEGRVGAVFGLACNNLNILGGEFQGNGSKAGVPTGQGGSLKGTGGGIFMNRSVQVTFTNTAIEGNVGDGLIFGEQVKGVAALGCYFEKNGSHPDNLDIGFLDPPQSGLGGHSGFILNCNFTPQDVNGTPQVRAIDVVDFVDMKIVNPQFFSQSGPVLYSASPIRIRETLAGRAKGWVEGGSYLSSLYLQPMVENLCDRFGYPRKVAFSPGLSLAKADAAETRRFVVPMPSNAGKRIDVRHITRQTTGTGSAALQAIIRRGPSGTQVSTKNNTAVYDSSLDAQAINNNTSNANWGDHCEISMRRDGTNAADTLASAVDILSIEVTTYEPRVAA